MKIVSTADEKPFIKMLVYGQAGVGKTVFASTAPNPLFVVCDTGTLSIRGKDIDKVQVETFDDVMEVYTKLKSGELQYETVVLDTLGNIQKKHMDKILAAKSATQASIADWQLNIEAIRKLVRLFRELPLNVIIICHESFITDDSTGEIVRILPMLQGKSLPNEVSAYMDIVGYIVAKERGGEAQKKGRVVEANRNAVEIVRMMRVQPSERIPAKDHSGKLGVWIEPDFMHIYEKVFGEYEAPPAGAPAEEASPQGKAQESKDKKETPAPATKGKKGVK